MASAFSHVSVPILMFIAIGKKQISARLLLLGFFLSVIPDLDSLGFKFGIPYESQWGHRGFTHSLVFAAFVALTTLPFARYFRANRVSVFLTSFISMASHGVLDALTSGGKGVAFFWPFNNERYFFPWHDIKVSPLSLRGFFSAQGCDVLASEFYYIWLPCLFVGSLLFLLKRFFAKPNNL
jgi:inner membrane protein